MGHGNSNKLYITHAEHSGALGQHTASSSGYKKKQEGLNPRGITPFNCCSLSFQPFETPVCARNADGTGTVFELTNIIPHLKQNKNKHPITGETIDPSSLISLHYHRNANDVMHDPVAFKAFSEHSAIIALATTGNVYLSESLKTMGNHDAIDNSTFQKSDIIILQDPHSVISKPRALPVTKETKPAKASDPKLVAVKEATPWNASPFSNGYAGASLTSTSVGPLVGSATALYDEEELMFEALQNVPKGSRKEKDIGKRRAYVRVLTSLGGSLNLELYCEKAPKTCYNFLMLARQGKYNDVIFHRIIPNFMVQTGDPTGTGSGGESYWGTPFRDEYDFKYAAKHDSRGVLSMANKGKDTNGSQWFLTFRETPHLDPKHTVFGKLVGGEDVLDALEKQPLKPGTDKPLKPPKITEVVIYQDPFEEYKQRLAKKLASQGAIPVTKEGTTARDKDVNWFGESLREKQEASDKPSTEAGVGKYLKRARDEVPAAPEHSKKRKVGWGNFDGW